ncbi:MAG: lamin tail domain-containing protein [DPANN group archaeon]|nr:lamin tail domain-containing protein [DPANN group archaeon]
MTALLLIAIGLFPHSVVAAENILISQVMYDPADESGGEAIELYNPNDVAVDLSFAVLKSESQEADATLPNGSSIPAEGYYLIADTGWDASKDDLEWPSADYEETLTFYNSDSGVALIIDGTLQDAVGWGTPENIEDGLFEGTPTNESEEGATLKRTPVDMDTDNNAKDFIIDEQPVFHNAQSKEKGEVSISVTATILDNGAEVSIFSLPPDEDDGKEGIQYYPAAGRGRSLLVEAEEDDPDGIEGMQDPNLVFDGKSYEMRNTENLSETAALFSTNLPLPFHQAPGNYIINVSIDGSSAVASVEVMPLVAIDADASALTFRSAIGDRSQVIGDQDMTTPDRPTIQNIGNTRLDISIYGDAFYSEEDILSLDSFSYSFHEDAFVGDLSGVLSEEPTTVPLGLGPGEASFNELSLRFEPLPDDIPGAYSGNIYLYGVTS